LGCRRGARRQRDCGGSDRGCRLAGAQRRGAPDSSLSPKPPSTLVRRRVTCGGLSAARYSFSALFVTCPLQRSDEPESMVDQKTLEEQERQAERTAMELLENEEAEKQAQVPCLPSVCPWVSCLSVCLSLCRRADFRVCPLLSLCVCVCVEPRETEELSGGCGCASVCGGGGAC